MGHKRGKTTVHLKGWWAEAYRADVGWAIGDGQEHGDDPNWDAREAEQLYSLLEEDIVPCFYKRDDKGIPRSWVACMRTSMAELTPQLSANRMVREYVDKLYSKCAKSYRKRSANGVQETVLLCGWYNSLRENWHKLRFGNLDIQRHEDSYVVTVAVYLDDIDSKAIRVQLYAEPVDDAKPEIHAMEIARIVSGTGNGYSFNPQSDC